METIIIVGIIFIGLSYVIGNLSSGYLISHFWGGIEVQNSGSNAVGATNVLRVTKKIKYAAATICIDMFVKGFLLIFAVSYIFGVLMDIYWVVLASFAAVLIGHTYPVISKFKTRGKGIATLIGGFIALTPGSVFIIAGAGWLLTFKFSKGTMSLSNLIAISILLLGGIALNPFWEFVAFTVFAAGLVYWSHRENVRRIWKGEEGRIELKVRWEQLWELIATSQEKKLWKDIINIQFK